MLTFISENGVKYGANAPLKLRKAVNGEKSLSGTVYSTRTYNREESAGAPILNLMDDEILLKIDRGWRVYFENEYYVITYAVPNDAGTTVELEFDAVHEFFYEMQKSVVYNTLAGSNTMMAYLDFIFQGIGFEYRLETTVSAFEKENFGMKNRLTLFNDIIDSTGVEFSVSGRVVRILDKVGTDLSTIVKKGFNLQEIRLEKNVNDFITYKRGFGAWVDDQNHDLGRLEVEYRSPLADIYGNLEGEPVIDERYSVGNNLIARLKQEVDASYSISVQLTMEDLTKAGYEYVQPRAGDYIMAINNDLGFKQRIRIVSYETVYDFSGELIEHHIVCNSIGLVDKSANEAASVRKGAEQAIEIAQQTNRSLNDFIISADGQSIVYYGPDDPQTWSDKPLRIGDMWYQVIGEAIVFNHWNGVEWVSDLDTRAIDAISQKAEQAKVTADTAKSRADDVWSEVDLAVTNAGVADLDALTKHLQSDLAAKADATATEMELAKKVAQTDYNTKVQALQSDINAKVASAAYKTDKLLIEADIAAKVAQDAYELKVQELGASIANKLATATYNADKLVSDAAIAGKVAQGAYDQKVQELSAAISNKLATATYNADKLLIKADIAAKVAQGAYDAKVQELDTAISGHGTRITQTETDIGLKASTTEVNALKTRINTAETSITANADAIALKASQSDLDTVEGRLSTAESSLTVQANEIASKVSQTNFDAVDGRLGTAESIITQQANQIASKVNQTDFDTLSGRVGTAETSITQTQNAITLKADKTTVETLGGVVAVKADSSTVSALTTRVSGAESSLTVQAGEIASKVSQSTYDADITAANTGLKYRMNSAESAITQNADAIVLKAAQSDLDTVEGRLSTAESSLTVQAGQIASKVESSTYESGLATKENNIIKTSTAPAHTNGKLWLDTSKTPNVLYRSTGSAWVKATPTTAAEVGAYSSSDGSALVGRISTAESTITQQANLIASKVSQTDFDAVEGRLDTAESSITQNANAIKLKASQSDLNAADGRLQTAESTLTVQANQIASKVNQTDFNALSGRVGTAESTISQQAGAIELRATRTEAEGYAKDAANGIKVGGRNYFRPQKVSCYYEHGTVTAKTEDGFTISYLSNINKYLAISVNDYVPQSAQYTFSGYLKVNGVIPSESIFAGVVNDYGNSFIVSEYNSTTGYFKFTQNFVNSQIWIIHAKTRNIVTGDLIKFEKVMFEFGNKESDFVPATEDTDLKISSVSSSLTVEAGKITALTTRIGDNELVTNTVIQTVEGIETSLTTYANKTDLNGLAAETWVTNKGYQTADMVSQTLSSYAKSTDLAGMVTETYLNNNSYQTAAMIEQTLTSYAKITALNGLASETWVSNRGYQTAAQITTTLQSYAKRTELSGMVTETYLTNNNYQTASMVTQTLSSYAKKTELSGLATEIFVTNQGYQTASQINQTLSSYATSTSVDAKINDIDIGGRNYIKSPMGAYYPYNTTPTIDSAGKMTFTKNANGGLIAIEVSGWTPEKTTYALSGIMKRNGVPVTRAQWTSNHFNNNFAAGALTVDDSTGYFEGTQTWDGSSIWVLHNSFPSFMTGDTITVEKFTMVKGNKSMDWSPPPEANLAKTEFSAFQTTYNQKATGWDSTTTYVTNNTTKLNSLISNESSLISTIQTIGVDGSKISQMVMTDSNFGVKVRENVSVGGRNYFQPDKVGSYWEYNAINGVTQDGFSTQYWGGVLTASIAGFIPKDVEYTISGYVKVNGAIKAQSIFSSAINTFGWDFKTAVYNTTTGYFKFTQKYVSSSHWIIHAPMKNVISGDLITFEKVMFELGNTAGDYVPAIESQVAKGEVYSQMMIDAEGILFDTTGNLVLSAEHVIFDTVNPVVIPSAAIPNLSADKITTGTLNAANVNVINVNANNITGKNASLIQASFNDINSSVQVDGTGLTTVDVTGLYAKYASGAITFGGGGEVVRMKNNTGNNPNRSGVALEPINSAMSNIDLDLYTRGIASLNIGKSDYDDGYRLRISSELANTNNYYFSLKSGTAFSFNFDARNYTDSRNSMQILQHNSAHHSIGKNQNWGSQLHFVNDDLIVAKGGTDNRTNLFAGGLYGRGVYYQYGTSTYDIAGTIADILSWIGSGVTWRMKS